MNHYLGRINSINKNKNLSINTRERSKWKTSLGFFMGTLSKKRGNLYAHKE